MKRAAKKPRKRRPTLRDTIALQAEQIEILTRECTRIKADLAQARLDVQTFHQQWRSACADRDFIAGLPAEERIAAARRRLA